jgi:hypothetical protein
VHVDGIRLKELGDPRKMTDTCALDVAGIGQHTLGEIGEIFGLTRERIRQIEEKALVKLRLRFAELQRELKDAE